MYNCSLLTFKDITDNYGHLTPIEGKIDIPFEIKRIYYSEVIEGKNAVKKG